MPRNSICVGCGSFSQIIDGICTHCLDSKNQLFHIGDTKCTYDQIIQLVRKGEISGFDIVECQNGERRPLHSQLAFSEFFMKNISSREQNKNFEMKKSIQKNPSTAIQVPKKQTSNIRATFRLVVLSLILCFVGYFFYTENPNLGIGRISYLPSPLVAYVDQTCKGPEESHSAFPNLGNIEKTASQLRSISSKEWPSNLVAQLLLDLTLLEGKIEPSLGDWIVQSKNVYREEIGIHAAYLSWRFRFAQTDSWCSEIGTCTHQVCIALEKVCSKQYKDPIENEYLQRFSIINDIRNGLWPTSETLNHVPEEIRFGILGDEAIERREFDNALTYYQKAFQNGASTEEDIFRAQILKKNYSDVITYAQENTFLHSGDVRSEESKRLLVRALMEEKKYQQAWDISITMTDRISVLHQRNLAIIMNKEKKLSPCVPQNNVEKLYCARLSIMEDKFEDALEVIELYPLGDPNRSLVELLIAMRRGDHVAMSDALQSFSYGAPEILSLDNASTATIPRISMPELNTVLRSVWKDEESKILHDWLFLSKTKRLFNGSITSAAICGAALQEGIRSKRIQSTEEALQCLSHFDMDTTYIRFFQTLLSHLRSSDLYPIQTVHRALQETQNRSLLYWGMVHTQDADMISQYQSRILGCKNERLGFGKRWVLSLSEP